MGTSGWSYKHWKETFYPKDIKQKEWLEYYYSKFKTVEVNNSFYRIPEDKTFESWKDSTPKNFLFSVKANRAITHYKYLKDKKKVDDFLEKVNILKSKLGPVLFQLPPNYKYHKEVLEKFLKGLPQKFRYTMEFRNKEWWNDEAYDLLKKYNVAFCIYELGDVQTENVVTADFVYIRLHGPDGKYKGNYEDNTLKMWNGHFNDWLDVGKDVYCYFDNDENGYAPKNALKLLEINEKS